MKYYLFILLFIFIVAFIGFVKLFIAFYKLFKHQSNDSKFLIYESKNNTLKGNQNEKKV